MNDRTCQGQRFTAPGRASVRAGGDRRRLGRSLALPKWLNPDHARYINAPAIGAMSSESHLVCLMLPPSRALIGPRARRAGLSSDHRLMTFQALGGNGRIERVTATVVPQRFTLG